MGKNLRVFGLISTVVLITLAGSGLAMAANSTAIPGNGVSVSNGTDKKVQYIIRFNDSADLNSEVAELKKQNAPVGKQFTRVFKGLVASLNATQLAAYSNRPSVASISEDLVVTAYETQLSPSAWGIDRIDQQYLPLSSSYNYGSSGAGVQIYVVDTGIRSTHQEFTGRVNTGFSAIADTNGTQDCNGHGTHVSSIAAGTTFGVAKSATLTPVRVLGCDGSGTTSGVISGLDWIAGQYVSGSKAVVNMSLGGGASSAMDTAVNSLLNLGITVVVAAGNSKADACTSSPARVPGAITVAATTNADSFATYSNYGSCVDLAAPGSAINGAWFTGDNASAILSGTSMASPHAAGVAAVFLAGSYQAPNTVSLALTNAATKGIISSTPAGTVNALLYANPAGITVPSVKVPLAPTRVVATAGRRAATVSWTQADNTGTPLISQTLKAWSGGKVVATMTVSSTATTAVFKLTAGVSYAFTVVANGTNASSLDSPLSNSVVPSR